MKKLIVLAASIVVMQMMMGCSNMGIDDTTKTTTTIAQGVPITVVEHNVSFDKWGLLVNTAFDQADLKYGPASLKVGGYSNAGDTATTKTITDGIMTIGLAYLSGGSSLAAPAAEKMISNLSASATPEAAAEAATPNVEPTKVTVVKADTSADVASGKYGIVVIGNRKGCPLCRSLWQPTFEADVEKVLPDADVIDADLTDNPALYKKYLPKEQFVYPYCIIFDAQGKRVGAFTARGVDTAGFTAKVSELCPECAPAKTP
jgi:hypothetical protein